MLPSRSYLPIEYVSNCAWSTVIYPGLYRFTTFQRPILKSLLWHLLIIIIFYYPQFLQLSADWGLSLWILFHPLNNFQELTFISRYIIPMSCAQWFAVFLQEIILFVFFPVTVDLFRV